MKSGWKIVKDCLQYQKTAQLVSLKKRTGWAVVREVSGPGCFHLKGKHDTTARAVADSLDRRSTEHIKQPMSGL